MNIYLLEYRTKESRTLNATNTYEVKNIVFLVDLFFIDKLQKQQLVSDPTTLGSFWIESQFTYNVVSQTSKQTYLRQAKKPKSA